MTAFDEQLIKLIDQRIAQYQTKTSSMGTCVSRATAGAEASVLFDGAKTPVPVKVLGHVSLRPGMRCSLDKYGSEWLVTGTFALTELGDYYNMRFGVGVATVTSATNIDHAGQAPFTFTKFHDFTVIDIQMTASGYSTAAATGCRWALGFRQLSGDTAFVDTDFDTNYMEFQVANSRIWQTVRFPYTGVPAGVYQVVPRWRRSSGAGTVTNAGTDFYAYTLKETVRSADPVV